MHQPRLPQELLDPPHQFSVMPFWFWNDDLDADELIRQIDDFVAHGVYGFVIHPRVGLPRTLGWMSDRLLDFYQIAIDAAARRNLRVILYDEGMYPSGSSAGQVVAENPAYQTRCLDKIELDATADIPRLPADQTLVAVVDRADGSRIAVIDQSMPSSASTTSTAARPKTNRPPPICSTRPQDSFIRHVYDGFAAFASRRTSARRSWPSSPTNLPGGPSPGTGHPGRGRPASWRTSTGSSATTTPYSPLLVRRRT
ncbi:MAG: hypothetical protein R2851_25870 [Caldilineaceae bacterium]